MAKRIVTGGTGMVGTAINADLKIGRKDCNLCDWNEVNAFFEKYKPEEYFPAAAKGSMKVNGLFFFSSCKR